ncbi:hypothetical protein [Novosphingobium sp. HII-3]|uniref:hypothetical protein n=1 Tax=Novosphingobium sp. HII-3 TaxID=2075565 RepID=UPI000CDB47F0|nr:hypothetical protein [Novosphingobium sp. HII-3]
MTDEAAKPELIDITSEMYRIYCYANGARFRINHPEQLYVLDGGSHRVVDSEGVTHRPTPGWLAISWKPKPGQPAFVA